MSRTHDVLIVGAGPTGLALAILLGQRGLRVAVIERFHDIYPLPRAVHIDDEVYRILHELGVGDEVPEAIQVFLTYLVLCQAKREAAAAAAGS